MPNHGKMVGIIGTLPPNFERKAQADARRQHRAHVLVRGDGDRVKSLGLRLNACKPGARCNSEACPICVGYFRKNIYQRATPILRTRSLWTATSVITAGLLVGYEELNTIDLDRMVKSIRKRQERSSIKSRMVFGGIDISLNLNHNAIIGWQLHLYLLIEGKNDPALRDGIRATFPPEPTAAVPYRFRSVDDISKAITYAYKSIFVRRSAYTKDGKAQTRSQPLKSEDLRMLLPFLDQYPIGTRLILRGMRRNGSRLVPTSRKSR